MIANLRRLSRPSPERWTAGRQPLPVPPPGYREPTAVGAAASRPAGLQPAFSSKARLIFLAMTISLVTRNSRTLR